MSEFSGMYLTKQGKNLLAKGQIGTTINFSKVVLGDGSLPDGQDIENLEAVISHKMDVVIHSLTIIGDGTSQIRFILINQGLSTGFFVREIGLMASDPDEGEILYAYANAGTTADFIPAGGGATVVENQIDLIAVVGNAANVIAQVGVVHLALKEDIEDHDVDPKAHDGRLRAIEEALALNDLFSPLRSLLELFVTNWTFYDDGSTTWTVSTGSAVAGNGGEYIALGLSLPEGNCDKAVVVRRTDNDGVLALSFRDSTHSSWTPVPWAWKRSIGSGWIDVEYLIPARNAMDIRIVSTRGASAVDPVIDFIAFVEASTGLGGSHNPPDTPSIVYPVNGAIGIGERPSITTSAYSHPTGTPLAWTEFQIALDAGFLNLVAESSVAQGISYAPDDNVLNVSTTYYVRARHRDINGGMSDWSAGISFTTDSSFVTVNKPSILSPFNGAEIGSPDGITLTSSAFDTEGGTDTHAASQWQVSTIPTFTSTVVDSGTDSTNKVSYSIADDILLRGQAYYCRVRHQGTAEGWSEYSTTIVFSIAEFNLFVTTLGGTNYERFDAVATDSSGNIYAAGCFYSADSSYQALLAKFAAGGTLTWQRTLGGTGNDYFKAVAIDTSGNVYAAGDEGSSVGTPRALLAKFAADGTLTWQRALGGTVFKAVVTDALGNIYAAGSEDISTGSYQALLAKFAADGTLTWQRTLGGAGNDYFKAVAIDTSGNVYAAGDDNSNQALLAKFAADGTLTWQRTLGGVNTEEFGAVITDTSGNIYAAGYESSSIGDHQALLAKFAADGTLIWQRTLGGVNTEHFRAVATDSSGNIYAAGFENSASSSYRTLLAKFTADGTLTWQRTLGGVNTEEFGAVITDTSGNIYAAGYELSSTGNYQALLCSVSSDAVGATGSIPNISALSWSDPGLSILTSLLTLYTSVFSVANPGLALNSNPALTLATSSLTQILSEY